MQLKVVLIALGGLTFGGICFARDKISCQNGTLVEPKADQTTPAEFMNATTSCLANITQEAKKKCTPYCGFKAIHIVDSNGHPNNTAFDFFMGEIFEDKLKTIVMNLNCTSKVKSDVKFENDEKSCSLWTPVFDCLSEGITNKTCQS